MRVDRKLVGQMLVDQMLVGRKLVVRIRRPQRLVMALAFQMR